MFENALFVVFVILAGLLAGLLWRARPQPQAAEVVTAPIPAPTPAASGQSEEWNAFVLGLSHELRTPLDTVIGFTEMLLETDLPEPSHRQVRMIADSGRAMMRLLNDILDITRIKSGQLRLVEESADVADEMRRIIDLLRPIADTQNIALVLDISPEVPPVLWYDRVRLQQVLLNLIGNAIKFTEHGAVTAKACVQSGKLELVVSDTGIGIAPDRIPHLFVPFASDMTPSDKQLGGTGLGLPMSQQLVGLMGGTISVTSTPGSGTTFNVHLPLRLESLPKAQDATPDPVAERVPAPTTRDLRGCRVLIAEDHAINQELILAMADALGLEAQLASDGAEAVEMVIRAKAQGVPFQLVLMDVLMPRMDGLAATRAIRAAGYDAACLPIVALTASCFEADIVAASEAGMQAHLAKPLTLATLEQAIVTELYPVGPVLRRDSNHGCDLTRMPEGISATIHSLEHRYKLRKRDLMAQLEHAISANSSSGPRDWDAILTGLHRLAGIAANFGDARLGDQARSLEQELRSESEPAARRSKLALRFEELREAA